MTDKKHLNIYYIFLEDKAVHDPPEKIKAEALKKFLKIFKKIKPNETLNPPIVVRGKKP